MAAPAPVFNWTGFYIGGNAGYGWKDPTVSYTPNDVNAAHGTCGAFLGGTCIPPASFNIGGALGGIQSGYNWQFNQQWIAGFETDFDWSEIKGTGTSNFALGGGQGPPPGTGAPSSFVGGEEIKWFGTIRVRLGWLPINNFLVYGTGGLAYGRVDLNATLNTAPQTNLETFTTPRTSYSCVAGPSCFVGSTSQTLVGWTAGAGGEYAITGNFTLRAEYLYINLGHAAGVSSVAQNALNPGDQASSFTANFSTVSFSVIRAGANWKF